MPVQATLQCSQRALIMRCRRLDIHPPEGRSPVWNDGADVSYNAGVVGGVITYWQYGSGGPGAYLFGGTSAGSLFHDVRAGDNSFGGVDGYSATRGYDLPTGWGTPNFGILGTLLADPNY